MIVWASCVSNWQRVRAFLAFGLARNVEPGDLVVLTQSDHIARAYNQILDTAGQVDAVVLLHDDTELLTGARAGILEGLKSADLVGPVGGIGVTELPWWSAQGVGRVDTKHAGLLDYGGHGPVDTLDGLLIALGPRAQHLRYDPLYPAFHGYDGDISAQACHAGLRVSTADIPVFHHAEGGYKDGVAWGLACERWKQKWEKA